MKLIKKLTAVFLPILIIVLCFSVTAYAATSTQKTGTTAGGSYGTASVTYKINGTDNWWPVHDCVYAYTKCDKALQTSVSAKIYGSTGNEEGSDSSSKITTSRVEVYVYADDANATSASSTHTVTSGDYGNFTGSLSCTYN